MSTNPFFSPWTTPFGAPPFDLIRAEHFAPAFDGGMEAHRAEIAAIADDPSPPGFANTIEAMERAGKLLRRVSAVFFNLVASNGGEAMLAVEMEYAPKLAQHGAQMSLNPALFGRVADLHARIDSLGLERDQRRLLERCHLGFVRAGAALDAAGRARMEAISGRLASLHAQFGQNVLGDERDWHMALGAEDLGGLPDFVVESARQAAVDRGVEGWVITLSRSLIEPFLTFSARRDLRQVAHAAWVARGTNPGPRDNTKLIPEILALRAERARLLGYAHFADFRLADTMAGSTEAVAGLTGEVWTAALRRVAEDERALLALAGEDGLNEGLAAWDWRLYAERLRARAFAFDEAEVKPYFLLDNIRQAAFDTAGRLFGLSFVERPDVPVYHPDVRAFEVRDADGHVGLFLADDFARADKRSGAWMSSYRDQEAMDEVVSPIIVNNNNFARATPALLSFDDARTLFHEFGHALHGLLSRVRYPSQSGTSVRRDFVEFPSQVYEHWLSVPETLQSYARHHETGEALPSVLMEKMLAARNFGQGFATVEYTASAMIDMELHAHPAPETLDIEAFEAEVMGRIGMPPAIGLRHRPPHFQHLFSGGGYAAGYYSYLWAEVLDADGFEAFREAGDPFDAAVAGRLRRVLASGDTEDPMELYVGFRGARPGTGPLLRGRGLV